MSNYTRDTVPAKFHQAKGDKSPARAIYEQLLDVWYRNVEVHSAVIPCQAGGRNGLLYRNKNTTSFGTGFSELLQRTRQWGTMNVSQMLHHLNLACGGSLGFYALPDESYLVSRTVFRWILVDWFPEQPVGLRLPKGFKIPHGAQFDFDVEKRQLLKILDAAWKARSDADWRPHPMFGRMTPAEWGKLLQIHIDYHLTQFAA